jgi:transposase-like protein
MVSFQGVHFEKDTLLTCVWWAVAYPCSDRQFEAMRQERGARSTTRPSKRAARSESLSLGGLHPASWRLSRFARRGTWSQS